MECAGKGCRSRYSGPHTRCCAGCGAVAYRSISHHIAHWSVHQEECERLNQQMELIQVLNHFPFEFPQEISSESGEEKQKNNLCFLLTKWGNHGKGMWICECSCGAPDSASSAAFLLIWDEGKHAGPSSPIAKQLSSRKDYYEWRCLLLHSPAALLLHWPLGLYQAFQLAAMRKLIPELGDELNILYLGAETELLQFAVFGELNALFPGLLVTRELVGPAIPKNRDGVTVDLSGYPHCTGDDCSCKSFSDNISPSLLNGKSPGLLLQLHRDYYHDSSRELAKIVRTKSILLNDFKEISHKFVDSQELIKEINVPAILATSCISTIIGCLPRIPIQLHPFRRPLVVKDSV